MGLSRQIALGALRICAPSSSIIIPPSSRSAKLLMIQSPRFPVHQLHPYTHPFPCFPNSSSPVYPSPNSSSRKVNAKAKAPRGLNDQN